MSNKKRLKQLQQAKLKKDEGKNTYKCGVQNEAVFFSFQYLTKDKNYNFEYLEKNKANQGKALKEFLKEVEFVSSMPWGKLQTLGKRQHGFETMRVGDFNSQSIVNKISETKNNITQDVKLMVFRFGGGRYRFVGKKSDHCPACIHLLGFDWDFTLYEHD